MSEIIFGEDIAFEAYQAAKSSAFVIADEKVCKRYPDIRRDCFKITNPEHDKTPETLARIIAAMLEKGVKRGDTVCVIGGGATGDIGGLAAALYMRGIKWINVPTTLLAMADAAIGGKTAVNINGIKNVMGAFHPPEKIIISLDFTDTLDDKQWLNGMGEIIKTCLLTKNAYKLLRQHYDGLIARDRSATAELVKECIAIKRQVTEADLEEQSVRKILNVGHTVAHAVESDDGMHGECVLKGILVETAMLSDIVEPAFLSELKQMIMPLVAPPRISIEIVLERALRDKKNGADGITVMLPTLPGCVSEVVLPERIFRERYISAIDGLRR